MKKTKILYWVFTGPIAAFLLFSGIQNALPTKSSVDLIATQMHYPVYIISFLGVAKILGVIGILIPGYPRIKEWAYAGLCFDLVGAMYSSVAIGEPLAGAAFFLLFIAFLLLSYFFYHKKTKAAIGNRIA